MSGKRFWTRLKNRHAAHISTSEPTWGAPPSALRHRSSRPYGWNLWPPPTGGSGYTLPVGMLGVTPEGVDEAEEEELVEVAVWEEAELEVVVGPGWV
jgi:hypothetical protein